MKKLSALFVLLLAYCCSYAASVSLSLTTAPCSNNGVLQATASGFTGTVTFTFYLSGTSVVNTTGTLTSYSGAPVTVVAQSGTQNAYSTFAGAPPFNYSVSTTTATCPAMSTATVAITGGASPYTVLWRVKG